MSKNEEQHDKKPHDKFFKTTFSDLEVVKDYVREFLPLEITKNLDLRSLKKQNVSYLTEKLEEYFSDIVYEVPYGKGKKKITITLLYEHKSYKVDYIHFQILRYMIEIWEQQMITNKPFTVILPIVIYHGKGNWKKHNMFDYFEGIDEELKQFIPNFDYFLTDLKNATDEEILKLKTGFLKNALLVLKHSRDKEYLLANVEKVFLHLERDVNKKENLIVSLLVYLLKTNDFADEEFTTFKENLHSSINELNMSTYDALIQQGEIRGMEKGIAVGMEKGKDMSISVIKLFSKGDSAEKISKKLNLDFSFVKEVIDKYSS